MFTADEQPLAREASVVLPAEERRLKANPYRRRILEFPGRIFCFDSEEEEIARIRELIAGRTAFCEIGSGSGKHLIERAAQQQNELFLGFELRFKRAVRTLEKADKRGIDNVFVMRANARLVDRIFPANSIQGFYINFPEPWDKRRWWKNRLLTDAFFSQCGHALVDDGFIAIKTDHQEYFQFILEQIRAHPGFSIAESSSDLYASPYIEGNVRSEFESLFLGQQLPIAYVKFVPRAGE